MENIENYFNNLVLWKNESHLLRKILLNTSLEETIKWNKPCYTYNQKNVVILHVFKAYCGLGFIKGILLEDKENLLIKPGENSEEARVLAFYSIDEIIKNESIIRAYLLEAIEFEKLGIKLPKVKKELIYPEVLLEVFKENPAIESAFGLLTDGRKRAYLIHFTDTTNVQTSKKRILNNEKRILMGKGLNDCICGQSKRMPQCDGSHKYFQNS